VEDEEESLPVKINTTRSRAKKGMTRKNNTSNRPEEILVHDIIKSTLPDIDEIKTQHKPPNIVPLKGTDLTGERSPKIDVYFRIGTRHYAIRVMGPIHDEWKRENYDFVQRTFLEMQPEKWAVIDFNYVTMQNVFRRNKRKLLRGELILAYNEVKKYLLPFGLNLITPSDRILEKLAISHCN